MEKKLQESIDRAIVLLGTSKEYSDYISIKLSILPSGCCCSSCLPETWRIINQFIAPCGPVGHEGDALIESGINKFVLESHESGLEIIALIDLIKKSSDCLKSIIQLIVVAIKAFSKEKRRQSVRIKILRRQVIKGVVEEENLIEIDFPISKDTERQLQSKLKNLIKKIP
ncbi:MAG: hypothetical protein WC090_00620 [Candidatus Omnitrophota bacterium]|jgi:hypothetical protein